MSTGSQSTLTLPERVVRNPSRRANTLHKIDREADKMQPACVEADIRDVEWNEVSTRAYHPHYSLCRNPGCFRRDWR